MTRITRIIVAGLLSLAPAALVQAQARPATTSAPARHTVSVPAGFKVVAIDFRNVILEPKDEAWVREALGAVKPTTLPSTMPSTLQDRLHASRDQLRQRIIKDLAISDVKVVDRLLNDVLAADLKQLEELNPPIFYLVATDTRLKELLLSGWTDPRFYLNRAANSIQVNRTQFSPTNADDVVVPVIYATDSPADIKTDGLKAVVSESEAVMAEMISRHAMIDCQLDVVRFIDEQVIKPLNLKPDQGWLGLGLAEILSCRYSSMITGRSLNGELIPAAITDTSYNPIRSGSLDLLHPNKPEDMRPEAIPYYVDASRVKSSRVVNSWLSHSGDDAIPKLLVSLRKENAADGAALVARIKSTSGIDLGPQLGPEAGN